MATGKAKTIDEIDNMKEMFDVMETLEISYPDLQKLDEMKSRAKSEFGQLLSISRWTAGEVSKDKKVNISNSFPSAKNICFSRFQLYATTNPT